MSTITDIETAQSKIASAADFPQFVQDLKNMGIQQFSTIVENSQSIYWLAGGKPIVSEVKYAPLPLTYETDVDAFMTRLKMHQEGKTDYYTFCVDSANSGIEKWVMDLDQMTCTYFDHACRAVLVETVPSV